MTRNVFCAKRSLIALAATLCLVFPGSNESVRAQVSPAAGSTYYVSTDGSDTAAGTEGAPFRTIQKAASLVGAGDTVVVRAGTYAGFQLGWNSPQSGTASQPITFKADPGAVIQSRNGETSDGINLEGSSYVVIDGFTVDNATPAPDTAPPEISNVRVSNVKRGSVRVTWITEEVSTTVVRYGRTAAYRRERSDTSLVVRHAITLTGLSANTRYHYRVESEDEAGNLAASADLTFKTAR